jgi:phospholipid/cholesterol/gamma-HCH transport system ATP-binding protein
MEPLIQVTEVAKRFGDTRVFERLTLGVRAGETLSIVGASGSGKSVLLKLLIGLLRPEAGSISYRGVDIVPLGEDELLPLRRRVSMLFQGGALFDSLTVGDNVAYPLRRAGARADSEIADRVADRLAMVGLPDSAKLWPTALSGGMKKRVALARAIVGDPEVVLYDEPTTGLDPITTRRIDDLIRSIQARLHVTSIVVTHDLPSAFLISDRVAMLGERRILAALPVAEFRAAELPAISEFVRAMALPVAS